ncbi:hypothetical protein HJC23_000113 [Cyclotella cryptica]|uniref:Uncharacterized protein n=1 Tax=Cyclotella cryptica TaxID=29204 RepID=A0ABD3NFV3_9STRA
MAPMSCIQLKVPIMCYNIHRGRWFSYEVFQTDDASDEEEEFGEVMKEVEEANARCHGSIQIMKESGQWGVYAARNFEQGELVISSKSKDGNSGEATKSSATSCAHSIQIDWNKHILMDLPARYLNHSCDPNVGVLGLNANGSYNFVALKDIACKEELRFDYETTEFAVGAFSICCCGSSNCRGKVRGYKYNGRDIREKYSEEYISSYLLRHNHARQKT